MSRHAPRCSKRQINPTNREANDSFRYKDFIHRLRIARKETKETIHCLLLLKAGNATKTKEIDKIVSERFEIKNILSSMISKATKK
ncbi:four helix bundle protein [Candidatus Uhrbacteria bacterium]|nr:four helix bundle protein [Candidatus Uhrbacteria bacterium]